MSLHYRGRFAPSPTGPLHFGSLISALVSYLDARHSGGQWLVRIEDIDPPREIPGAADTILSQLDAHGLQWDDDVLYQSRRQDAYLDVLADMRNQGILFPCRCTRQQLAAQGGVHRQPCRGSHEQLEEAHALRVHVPTETMITFDDLIQGRQQQDVSSEVGDFVLLRKDMLPAYQLAVVVDDAFQDISHVIRGRDLLESTARQIYLQQRLGYSTPQYGHHPLVLNRDGQKLSKQNLATAIDSAVAASNLQAALKWLNMTLSEELVGGSCEAILSWAAINWNREKLHCVSDRLK